MPFGLFDGGKQISPSCIFPSARLDCRPLIALKAGKGGLIQWMASSVTDGGLTQVLILRFLSAGYFLRSRRHLGIVEWTWPSRTYRASRCCHRINFGWINQAVGSSAQLSQMSASADSPVFSING